MLKKLSKKHGDKTIGQSLVEIAISFPLLLIIVSGLIDIGRIYYVYLALEDAAAEGALYLAVDPDCRNERDDTDDDGAGPDVNECLDPNNALYRTRNATQRVDLTRNDIAIEAQRPDIFGIGDVTQVTIRYPYRFITPGIQAIAEQVILEATATNVIVGNE